MKRRETNVGAWRRRLAALAASAAVCLLAAPVWGQSDNVSLVVDADVAGQVMIFDGDELVMELARVGGEPTEVGLPADVYRVVVRDGATWRQAEVRLAQGQPAHLTVASLKVMSDGQEPPCNLDFDIDWDFGLTLSSGTALSPVPEYDELLIHHFGLELRVESFVLQWRLRYGHDQGSSLDHEAMPGHGPELFSQYLVGTDLGLLGHWGWDWVGFRLGLRGGVDFQVQEQGEPDGVTIPAENEDLWLVLRGGVVGQIVLRPLDWLGLFAEVSTDLYLDGSLVEGAQGGVTFYLD